MRVRRNRPEIDPERQPRSPGESAWAALPLSGQLLRFPPGAVLYRQGDPVDCLYLIRSGAVKLKRSEGSDCETTFALRLPNSLLAMASAILETPHPDTAVALGWCEVHRVSLVSFRERCHENALFARAVEQALAAGEQEQVVRVSRSGLDALTRLIRLLRDLAELCGTSHSDGGVRLGVRLTQADLGELIGTSREHVNRLLMDLGRRGVVRRKDGWLVVRVASRRS
jgi:CRP/FNR family transcriptional regulator